MRGTYEESDKPLKSLAKHVRDLRKLWYMEHEQNRRLVTFIQNNTSCKAESRSVRGVSNHSRGECSDLLNVSRISTDLNASRLGKTVEIACALSCKLNAAVLKVTRQSFSVIVQKPCTSLHRLRVKMCSAARIAQHLALRQWRFQAHTASIVYCVNTDLRYIRSLDRLDVLVTCKVREVVKKTFLRLNQHRKDMERRGRRLETLFHRMSLREKWLQLKCWTADKKVMEKAIALISQSWNRRLFLKLHFIQRLDKALVTIANSLRRLQDYQRFHIFGLFVGLANLKKTESLESTGLTLSVPSSSRSPEKAQQTVITALSAATSIGLLVTKAIYRVQTRFFLLLRKSPVLRIQLLDGMVWRLSSHIYTQKSEAMKAFQSLFSYEKRKMRAQSMFETLESVHLSAGKEGMKVGWKRLIEFHERDIVRKQGIEVLAGALLTAQTRKELKSGLDPLKTNLALRKKQAKGLFSISNVLRHRQIGCFYTIVHEKALQRSISCGTIRLMMVLERHSFTLQHSSFQALKTRSSFLKLIKALWTWKYSKEIRVAHVQKGLSNVKNILHRLSQEAVLSAVFTWKRAVSAFKCVDCGLKLLKRPCSKRLKDVFDTLKHHKQNAVLESSVICLVCSLESALSSLHRTNVQVTFRTIARYPGFPWKIELEKVKRVSSLNHLVQVLEFHMKTIVLKTWGNLHLRTVEGKLTRRTLAGNHLNDLFSRKETNTKKAAFQQITQIGAAQKQALCTLHSVFERACSRYQFIAITTLKQRSEIARVTSIQQRHSAQCYGVKLLVVLLRIPVSQVKSLSFNQVKAFSVSHDCKLTYTPSAYISSSSLLSRSRPIPHLSRTGLGSSPHQFMSQSIGGGSCAFPSESQAFGKSWTQSISPHRPLRTLTTNFL